MSKKSVISITFLILMVLQGCATNVVYNDKDRKNTAVPLEHGISVFFDRDGDLYPPSAVTMNGSMFTASRDDTATLRAYFEQVSNRRDWESLLTEMSIDNSSNPAEVWSDVQSKLFSNVIESIVKGSNSGNRKIIFLVHGYNNEFKDAESWYKPVEQDIKERAKDRGEQDPYFVRVHWDGLSQTIPISIWTKAQWNGPITGLSLRRILSGLDGKLTKDTQIAMLSHSTGALVVVNAVGDGSAALDCEGNFKERCVAISDTSSIPKLVSNVRLGMLIPAASLDTFNFFNNEQKLPQAIVLGLNKQDFPTNKVFGCIWLGSTCMNVKTEQTCNNLKTTFSNLPVDFYVFEFSNSLNNENQTFMFWETHKVQDQMKRDMWSAFIERVLFLIPDTNFDNLEQCKQKV
ncbi:hypothetical protein [Shewanella mangrovisoli]|uniref:hypothetical protein n=1 Tax=Shewanella mangrovisoli TaxID=2864211 RepID=UPI0035B8593A